MCGIWGHSFQRKAKVPSGQREVLCASLAVANSYRGSQSWGVYVAGQKGKKPRTRREVGDIANVEQLGNLAAWPVMFGHTRHATTGAVTRENQHPFRVGHILLAHNGMVWNHYELNRKYERSCTVDSEHFAHHISGGLPFTDLEGYGALEWTDDKRPTTIFLCRMRDGVLSVAGVKNRRGKQVGTVWSSDKDHLERALEASRLDYFWYEKPAEGAVYEVTAGRMFTTKRPALVLAAPVVSYTTRRAAMRATSGYAGNYYSDGDWGEHDSWWGRHFPATVHTPKDPLTTRTSPTRSTRGKVYKWDARSREVIVTDSEKRPATTPTTEDEASLWEGQLLSDAGAGGSLVGEDEDYDAEAARLGLTKIDEGMWIEPGTGTPVDRDGIDDLLDAEEDEGLADFDKAPAVVTDSEEEAWKRTVAAVRMLPDHDE
jgi:predicted glutamine amidotransferase